MAKESTLDFSIPKRSQCEVTDIGFFEGTVWSVSKSSFGGRLWVDIIRSLGNGEVKIDVLGAIKGNILIMKYGHRLMDGQKTTRLYSGSPFEDDVFKGYVKIYSNNVNDTLVSTTADTVNSENGVIPSTAEKISPPTQLAKDLLQVWENPDSFSDATLVCDTTKFPVHRVILSARSPVFDTMFKTQMQEGRDGIVNIVDMEPDVLQAMLRYVYSGTTDHLTCYMAGDLLFAADKYQLEELKMICVEQLKVGMNTKNVFRSVVLGDLHDKSLKTYAVEFICKYKNFSDLEKTEEWQSLLKERPSLAVDVATTVVKYLQKK